MATNEIPADILHLETLEDDPEYWDYLDELEARACGTREWDNAGGAKCA